MTLTLRYAARSDRGLIRQGNQDSVYAGPRLLAVADGMGGMAAGDVASLIVITALAPLDDDVPGNAPVDALRGAVDVANQRIRDMVSKNPSMEGMGTTLTGMLFGGSTFGMVHIGDSRAYLLRDGQFVQITHDDTYVQMLVDEGRITPEEANTHPQKSLLMRALDGRDAADPEYSVRHAVPGDRYLICSDGLSGVVSDETIGATLREYGDPDQCAERLVQLALRGGGPDNVTVIVADVTDAGIVEERPVVGGAAANDQGATSLTEVSTPATRAAAITRPRDAVPPVASLVAQPAPRKRHPVRATLVTLLVLAVVAGGLYGGWSYTQTKYYIGVTDDGTVAVFRGIPASFAGFRLSEVDLESGTSVDDLTQVAREKVLEGIPAGSYDEARAQMDALLDPFGKNVLPWCPTPAPSGSASPTPTPGPSESPSPDPSASAGPSVSPGAPETAGPSVSADPSVSPDPSLSAEPSAGFDTPTLSPSPIVPVTSLPTGPPDCRVAK